MKAQAILWTGILFILSGCDQYTERDVLAKGDKKAATNSSSKKRDSATFSVKAPKAEDTTSESREGTAKKVVPVLICKRIEQAIEIPALTDPCVIGVDQISEGKYSLRRIDIEVKQAETKETLRFSRECKEAGKFQAEDTMRRDVLWGASNEVVADLNLAWDLWKTKTGIKFDKRFHHNIIFDELKSRVISKNIKESDELGARMYELFTQAPKKDAKSKSAIKLMSGNVSHPNVDIFEPDTNHAVRVELDPILVKGKGVVRKVGKDDSTIQLIVLYQLTGGNDLNYVFGVAYEYTLIEKMVQFKGSVAGN